jgi:hypothetical protein
MELPASAYRDEIEQMKERMICELAPEKGT